MPWLVRRRRRRPGNTKAEAAARLLQNLRDALKKAKASSGVNANISHDNDSDDNWESASDNGSYTQKGDVQAVNRKMSRRPLVGDMGRNARLQLQRPTMVESATKGGATHRINNGGRVSSSSSNSISNNIATRTRIDTNPTTTTTTTTTTVVPLPLQQQVSHQHAMNEQAKIIAQQAKTIKKQAKTVAKQMRLVAQYKSFMPFVSRGRTISERGKVCTPLQYAIKSKQFDVASSLIAAAGADDLSVQDNDGYDALHYAVHVGALEIARLLLAKVVSTDAFRGFPTSHLKKAQSAEMVRVFLIGATVHVLELHRDENGRSALHYFAGYDDHLEMAQCLVEACPAMLFQKDRWGNTPLHMALKSDDESTAMISYLAKRGGPDLVNATDILGQTALCHAIDCKSFFDVQLLVETFDADLLVTNGNGCTALHLAILTGRLNVARCILQQSRDKGIAAALVEKTFESIEEENQEFLTQAVEFARPNRRCPVGIHARLERDYSPAFGHWE